MNKLEMKFYSTEKKKIIIINAKTKRTSNDSCIKESFIDDNIAALVAYD